MKLPQINAATERPTRAKQHVVAAHAAVEGVDTVRLNVEIPGAMHRALKMRAAQEGKTIKEVVLAFLAEYSK